MILGVDTVNMSLGSPCGFSYESEIVDAVYNSVRSAGINLMVSAYLRTADLGVFLRMQNDLNLNIMDVMKADGVDFAFPSTTVYLAKEN